MIAWMAVLACSGTGDDSGGQVDSDPGTDIVYPTGDRVLLYTGHNGEGGSNSGVGEFDGSAQWVKDTYGWNVSSRTDLADPTQYRVMILVDSGVDGSSTYGDETVSTIQEGLAAGVRLVTVVSPENCAGTTFNALFEDLGIATRYTGTGSTPAKVSAASPARTVQLTSEVSEARFLEPCFLEANGATVLFADDRDVLVTVERIGAVVTWSPWGTSPGSTTQGTGQMPTTRCSSATSWRSIRTRARTRRASRVSPGSTAPPKRWPDLQRRSGRHGTRPPCRR